MMITWPELIQFCMMLITFAELIVLITRKRK